MSKKRVLKALDSLGVRTSAFKILCYLTFKQGELKPSEISEGLGMKAGTVRARLSELKEAKLVRTLRDGYVSNILPYDILMRIYEEIRREMKEERKSG
ncbi:transcriptional regulator [Candidatus Bathyarchaeota archaeon]|nr:helix-turn-helix transcriptional regulator [Candidatus Bathyarchaeota archaeon]RJS89236.1 MAG: transcriptional regulator [Candidatus Bathyarchaeota archaeon]